MIKPIVLWSDIFIFLLVLGLVGLFTYLKPSSETQANWRKVFESRLGCCSFMILCLYIFIALLDSLHFQKPLPSTTESSQVFYSNEVLSILDLIHVGMLNKEEKTYSAPFSIYSYSKENMFSDSGQLYRDFPRLMHGGSHLRDDSERMKDIFSKTLFALVKGIIVSGILIGSILLIRRTYFYGTFLPVNSACLLLGIIVTGWIWVVELGAYYHILGTNKVGADVLYQAIKSIRTGILLGTLAALFAVPFAIVFGISAGYFKGKVDDAIQYLYTTLSSIPDILLIAAAVLVIDVYIENHTDQFNLLIYRADFKFLALCAIFGLTSWTGLCRLLRAETLKVSQLDYVNAARAFGVSHTGVITRHILPNVMHLVIISTVLNFSGFVLAESVLAYIGVGVDASMSSWGNMINSARQELSRDPAVWWSILSAFVFMFILVLSANLFSDKVRDAFDPRGLRRMRLDL